jgi:nitroreductase
MTSIATGTLRRAALRRAALRRAAVRATLAPSIHNTQPWRFVLGEDELDVHVDWGRQLRVSDPRGRQLLISLGCALFNARVALAAAGQHTEVERLPRGGPSDLAARLRITEGYGEASIAVLDKVIEVRQTNRRRFADEAVPADVVADLVDAANAEGAELFPIVRAEHRLAAARLSTQAQRVELQDPSYRAELRAWTSDDPRRLDGVPAAAVPYAGPGATSNDLVPMRVFDSRGMGWLPADAGAGSAECLLLLGTRVDGPAAWIAAGEALERVWLECTLLGYAVSPFTQVTEVGSAQEALRRELSFDMYPNVLLRVGRAPETVRSRRRRLVEMLTESE